MKTFNIKVERRVATFLRREGYIICGNSDYKINFTFDSEWSDHDEKTARFIWNNAYQDVTFSGNECTVPTIDNASEVHIGVYVGELKTTTSAVIPCHKSVKCESTVGQPEQVKEYRDAAAGYAEEAKAALNSIEMQKGAPKGVAELDENGKVPALQLPSAQEQGIPLVIPYTVSYGVETIDGIIGDKDSLEAQYFTRPPATGDIFFFIATTRKGDVCGVTAEVLPETTSEKVIFAVVDATLLRSGILPLSKGGTGASTADVARTNLGLKTETWTFTVEKDGKTETVDKEVFVK